MYVGKGGSGKVESLLLETKKEGDNQRKIFR